MACGCGGKRSYAAVIKSGAPAPQAAPFMGGQMLANDTCAQENTIKIRYNGPTGNHLVASPLRKFPHYGMHTNGDVFCVHVDDQLTAPNIFVLVPPPAPKPVSPPVRPVVVEPVAPPAEEPAEKSEEELVVTPEPTEVAAPAVTAKVKPAQPGKKRQARKEK